MAEAIESGPVKKKAATKASSIRIGRRYRASRVDDDYDVIVIGSGPGGLSTAACLSRMGKKVAVFEQHYTAGGFTHAYERNGYEWDVGVHFMNEVATPGTLPRKLFDFISDGNIHWRAMDEDKLLLSFGDGPRLPITMQASKDRRALQQLFPEESEAIDAIYAHGAKTVQRGMPMMLGLRLTGSGFLGRLLGRVFSSLVPADLYKTCYEVVSRFTDNEKLIRVVCCLWIAAGITPDRLSYMFVAGAQINESPMGFPIGGSAEIAKNIIPVIQQGGGDLYTYARVDEVVFEAGRASGVRMSDGHVVRAPQVVSTAGVFNTFTHLVPEALTKKYGYDKKLERVDRAVGHFNLFVGFNQSTESLGLHDSEHLVFKSYDFEKDAAAFNEDLNADIPFLYMTFPSAKDGAWSQRYPNKSTASIFFYIENFDHFKKWRHETWEHRGEEYDALKEDMAQRVLEILFRHYPHLRDKVDYYEFSTPLSTRHFNMYEHGEIYGLHGTPERMKQTWLKPKTRIPGLYLAGQDALLLGHTTGALTGLLAAWNVLGFRKGLELWKKVNA